MNLNTTEHGQEGAGERDERATKTMSELTSIPADIQSILAQARSKARSAVNAAMVEAYWLISQRIVQEEQQA